MGEFPIQTCPKCGCTDIDHPRHYGPGMRFQGCSAYCKQCRHEEWFETHREALFAWAKP